MDWYFTHSPTLFPLTKNQADYLNIVKKLLGLFQKLNPEIKQKSFVIIYKHPEFFSKILNMLLNKYQEKSSIEKYKALIEPFLVQIEFFDNSLVNLSSYLNLLEIYLAISPKLYPIALYKEEYIQIYINLCALYSKTQHKDITSFIESHKTFFLELTNECMFSHMSESYAKEQVTSLTAPLLESTSSSAELSVRQTVFFPLMDFAKALQTPSHCCLEDNEEQMRGDSYQRIVWLLAIAALKQAQLSTAQVTIEDCKAATDLLIKTYGASWLSRQKKFSNSASD